MPFKYVVYARSSLRASEPLRRLRFTISGLASRYGLLPLNFRDSCVLFSVHRFQHGECFGFLGINGAGKTTSLSMLTGDLIPTSGTAMLEGLNIMTHQKQLRRLLGYCPQVLSHNSCFIRVCHTHSARTLQFDALIDSLTGREHLTLFCRIKVPSLAIASCSRLRRLISHLSRCSGSERVDHSFVCVVHDQANRYVVVDAPSCSQKNHVSSSMASQASNSMPINRVVAILAATNANCLSVLRWSAILPSCFWTSHRPVWTLVRVASCGTFWLRLWYVVKIDEFCCC